MNKNLIGSSSAQNCAINPSQTHNVHAIVTYFQTHECTSYHFQIQFKLKLSTKTAQRLLYDKIVGVCVFVDMRQKFTICLTLTKYIYFFFAWFECSSRLSTISFQVFQLRIRGCKAYSVHQHKLYVFVFVSKLNKLQFKFIFDSIQIFQLFSYIAKYLCFMLKIIIFAAHFFFFFCYFNTIIQ